MPENKNNSQVFFFNFSQVFLTHDGDSTTYGDKQQNCLNKPTGSFYYNSIAEDFLKEESIEQSPDYQV